MRKKRTSAPISTPNELSVEDLAGVPMAILWVLSDARRRWNEAGLTTSVIKRRMGGRTNGPGKNQVNKALSLLKDNAYIVTYDSTGRAWESIWMLTPLCPPLMGVSQQEPGLVQPQPLALPEPPEAGYYAGQPDLPRAYFEVVTLGKTLATLSMELAATLAENGGADYLRHALGWAARVCAGNVEDYNKPGSYFYKTVKERTPLFGDGNGLPPLGLTWAEVLRWAQNGGRTDAEIQAEQNEQARLEAEADVADTANAARVAVFEAVKANQRLNGESIPAVQTWRAAMDQLKLEMPRATFDTWLRGAEVIRFSDAEYVIGVADAYRRDWLENRLLSAIKRAVAAVAGKPIEIAIEICVPDNSTHVETAIASIVATISQQPRHLTSAEETPGEITYK